MKTGIALPLLVPPPQLSLDLFADGYLPALPEMVRARTLRQPYAGLVAAVPRGARVGLKDLETRKSTIAPGLLVVCAGLEVDDEAEQRLSTRIPGWAWSMTCERGQALALVLIGASRPLVPEDEPRAWCWKPGRKAMQIERCWPFKTPFKQRGMPGDFLVKREHVLEALHG